MGPRISRNAVCWCGSGKKFKKCHMYRESAPRPTLQKVIETAQEAYSHKVCLHPDPSSCQRGIIKAHSIQQNGGLSKIAVNGRVYGIQENNVGDLSRSKGVIVPKLVSIGKASTFTGMCGFHDDHTFAPIEKYPFVSCPEHTFLLAYRNFCKELFAKLSAANLFETLRDADNSQPFEVQFAIQHFVGVMKRAFDQGHKDVERIKADYDKSLLAKDYSATRYYAIRFNEVPDLLACSGNYPEFDFAGNRLQSLLDPKRTPEHVTFSIIATDSGGVVVFSWLGDMSCPERLVKSLHALSDADIGDAIIRHAFEYCENIYMSPKWWNGLEETKRTALCQRISAGADVTAERRSDCLVTDGNNYVNWTVLARETNLML